MQFWWYWSIGLHCKVFNCTPLRLDACTQIRYLNIIGGTAYSVHCIYDDNIIVVFQFDYFIRDGEQRGHFAAFINCHALFHAYSVLWHDMSWITFWKELCPREHQIFTLSTVYKKHTRKMFYKGHFANHVTVCEYSSASGHARHLIHRWPQRLFNIPPWHD